MINDLKYYDGSVKGISRIPEEIKDLFATAFDRTKMVDRRSKQKTEVDRSKSIIKLVYR